jgi:hypothetical protein
MHVVCLQTRTTGLRSGLYKIHWLLELKETIIFKGNNSERNVKLNVMRSLSRVAWISENRKSMQFELVSFIAPSTSLSFARRTMEHEQSTKNLLLHQV